MRFLALFATVALAACSGNQLARDLRDAESSCDHEWPSKAALVACLDDRDHAIWAQEEPATLDLYESFARQRNGLARDYDRGLISADEYRAKLSALKEETRSQMTERRTGPS